MSFQPTLGIFDTARNVKTFCTDNKSHFRKLLLSMLPFLFISGLVQAVPHDTTEMKILFALMLLLQIYIYTMLVVTWHRFTIQGPSSDQDINIFEKKAGVWPYLGFSIALGAIGFAVMLPGIIIGLVLTKIGVSGAGIPVLIVSMFAAFYVSMRLLIILPSIAVGRGLKIKEAFALSKGMILKLMFTPAIAAIKPILLMIAYLIVAIIVIIVAMGALQLDKNALENNLGFSIFVYILFCPITLYLQPWMTVLSVTSLSNYYLWATQNAAQEQAPAPAPAPAASDTLPPV